MSEPILIGTRGWQHAEWADDFYPRELPGDWRFCFYSNRLRAVLVPGEDWRDRTVQAITQWAEDSDPAFRFVLELPPDWRRLAPGALAAAFDGFRVLTAPIHARAAGLVVRAASAPEPAWLAALFDAIGDFRPVAVDLAVAQRTAELQSLCARRSAAWCWRSAEEQAPEASGRLTVALAAAVPPRAQRRMLEQLNAARAPQGVAALFFEGAQAAKAAEEARILAELMAV